MRVGAFDAELAADGALFDAEILPEGWFDPEFVGVEGNEDVIEPPPSGGYYWRRRVLFLLDEDEEEAEVLLLTMAMGGF